MAFTDPTQIINPFTTANEDVVYGLNEMTGALEQISVRNRRRSLWTLLRDVFGGCTTGVLFADLPVPPVTHIGLQPRLQPYIYDYKVDNANQALNVWTSDQQLGVDDAFERWNDVAPEFAN